jgi:hypothetical protein
VAVDFTPSRGRAVSRPSLVELLLRRQAVPSTSDAIELPVIVQKLRLVIIELIILKIMKSCHRFGQDYMIITMRLSNVKHGYTLTASRKREDNRMVHHLFIALFLLVFAVLQPVFTSAKSKHPKPWRAVHLLDYNTDAALDALGQNLETLAKQGINVIILEVDYNFAFKSHPELKRGTNPITRAGARRFAELCEKFGIRLIPEFQSLGHQSWKAETFPLLTVYPNFDLTPGAFPKNEGIYCREWDPLNPEVWPIVFKLMDEIIDAFRADAFHVGMDEVFLLGSEKSPSTKGKDPGVLFANAVNKIHQHLVRKRRVEMLMWGDRLIDGNKHNLGEWEAATNGTATAIDMIPKDIIICPWHYEPKPAYPSIPMFIQKGFRVLPAGWNKVDATKALIEYSRANAGPKMLGHLFTTWGVKKDALLEFEPLVEGLKLLQDEQRP